MATTVDKREVEVSGAVHRPSLISWGAVIAGLVVAVAISWLMFLLGSAIGLSIADATDFEAMGEGLGIGTVIWILLTAIIAYFLGGLVTGRLAGKPDKTTGLLHGVTLWGTATIFTFLLGYAGIANLLQGGGAVVQGAASLTAGAGSAVATGISGVAAAGASLADVALTNNPLMNSIQAQLKRRASAVIAQVESPGGADVSQQEVQQALNQLDSQTLQQVTIELIQGNIDAARSTLAANTALSPQEIDDIINGISNEFAQELQVTQGGGDAALLNNIQQRLTQRVSSFIAAADATGGPDVTQQAVNQAIQQLSPQTLQSIALELFRGDTEAAKNLLTVNTNLSEAEVNDIVDGIANEIQQPIQQLQTEVNQVVEAVSSYAQAVFWTLFVSSAIALLMAILGGWVGADTVKRLGMVERHATTRY